MGIQRYFRVGGNPGATYHGGTPKLGGFYVAHRKTGTQKKGPVHAKTLAKHPVQSWGTEENTSVCLYIYNISLLCVCQEKKAVFPNMLLSCWLLIPDWWFPPHYVIIVTIISGRSHHQAWGSLFNHVSIEVVGGIHVCIYSSPMECLGLNAALP